MILVNMKHILHFNLPNSIAVDFVMVSDKGIVLDDDDSNIVLGNKIIY